MKVLSTVLDLIGNTPLMSLARLVPAPGARLLAKLENRSLGGSVKDRVALAMVRDAEQRGVLRPGVQLLEASGGNMGISLALVGAALGYTVGLVMPDSVPQERRRILSHLGARLYLTSSHLGMEGAHRMVQRLLQESPGSVCLDQFRNPANTRAHREGTAREILEATHGEVDAFVAGVGTGGTITGVGEALKEARPSVHVVAVEPAGSPLLSEGRVGEHTIPGLGADFVPPLLNRAVLDEVATVTDQQANEMALLLAREMGLLVGPSSGANVYVALRLAERLGPGKTVVTVLPDDGEHYVSLA